MGETEVILFNLFLTLIFFGQQCDDLFNCNIDKIGTKSILSRRAIFHEVSWGSNKVLPGPTILTLNALRVA